MASAFAALWAAQAVFTQLSHSHLQPFLAMIRQQACVFMYLQDAYLPQRLVDKLMYMYNYIEMARVTGVPMSFLLTRGQSIKVFSQILRKARQKNLLVPFLKVGLHINQQHCSHSAQPPFSKEVILAPVVDARHMLLQVAFATSQCVHCSR